MQTFLPYKDFEESAKCLDSKRLGKQRVEANQILNVNLAKLRNPEAKLAWQNHPAVLMWRGYEECLKLYINEMIIEWTSRGFNNTMAVHLPSLDHKCPDWLGNAEFHASHRSNLLRKDAVFYGNYDWSEPEDLPYYWPTHKQKEQYDSKRID